MSAFAILVALCEELERLMNSFWYGSMGPGKRKIHWLSWYKMCLSKGKGVWIFKILGILICLYLVGRVGHYSPTMNVIPG